MRFTRTILEEVWEEATSLPAHSGAIGTLPKSVINEALEGSEGEYPDILGTLDRIVDDLTSFQEHIVTRATYRYEPCRDEFHETCVGEVIEEPTIPQFCMCPCHGDREEGGE